MPLADDVEMQLAENRNAFATRVFAEFSLHPKRNALKSAEAGREVFDDVEYVRIVVPGERDGVHRPATQRDRESYPKQYAAFKQNLSQDSASGTPLSHVPWLPPSLVAELRHFNCRTVEQLAGMPDAAAQKFPGILALRQKAKDFIAVAQGAAPVAQLREELEAEKQKSATLEARLAELAEEVKALHKRK